MDGLGKVASYAGVLVLLALSMWLMNSMNVEPELQSKIATLTDINRVALYGGATVLMFMLGVCGAVSRSPLGRFITWGCAVAVMGFLCFKAFV